MNHPWPWPMAHGAFLPNPFFSAAYLCLQSPDRSHRHHWLACAGFASPFMPAPSRQLSSAISIRDGHRASNDSMGSIVHAHSAPSDWISYEDTGDRRHSSMTAKMFTTGHCTPSRYRTNRPIACHLPPATCHMCTCASTRHTRPGPGARDPGPERNACNPVLEPRLLAELNIHHEIEAHCHEAIPVP